MSPQVYFAIAVGLGLLAHLVFYVLVKKRMILEDVDPSMIMGQSLDSAFTA